MVCGLNDLKRKEVIDITNGERLGFIDDIEIDTESSGVMALIIYGRPRFFGILGRDDDIVVKCDEIAVIGKDTILIRQENTNNVTKRHGFSLENLYK